MQRYPPAGDLVNQFLGTIKVQRLISWLCIDISRYLQFSGTSPPKHPSKWDCDYLPLINAFVQL